MTIQAEQIDQQKQSQFYRNELQENIERDVTERAKVIGEVE